MGAPFVYSMPVRFSDIDHAGIVYYPVFFHYFHVAFEEFFRARISPRSYAGLMDDDRIGFPAVSSRCDFKAPLRFGDTVEIEMSVARLGERSIEFAFHVYRAEGEAQERTLCAVGANTCAVVDLDRFRAVPLPEHLRALLSQLTRD